MTIKLRKRFIEVCKKSKILMLFFSVSSYAQNVKVIPTIELENNQYTLNLVLENTSNKTIRVMNPFRIGVSCNYYVGTSAVYNYVDEDSKKARSHNFVYTNWWDYTEPVNKGEYQQDLISKGKVIFKCNLFEYLKFGETNETVTTVSEDFKISTKSSKYSGFKHLENSSFKAVFTFDIRRNLFAPVLDRDIHIKEYEVFLNKQLRDIFLKVMLYRL